MPAISHTQLLSLGSAIFQAAGVPTDQADIAIHHLVESNLMGHDSHGIIRLPGYVRMLQSGGILPVGSYKVVRETPASQVIDADRNFGIVLTYQAMQTAIDRAKEHTFGAVAVHRSSHIGRLGAYPPQAAAEDCIGLIMLNGGSRFTAPFGGVDRRLPPNPIAMSVPTLDGPPLMLDITTSMVAGGKVQVQQSRNQSVPEGWLIDEHGQAMTDPNLFMDGLGAMLPLGGSLGHKGYGLGVMIDAIAGGLSWAGCSTDEPTRGGSGYLAMAIKIESFIDVEEYKREVQRMIDWIKSSRTLPGVDRIYLPGEIENETRKRREAEGIPLPDSTWSEIQQSAEMLGVEA